MFIPIHDRNPIRHIAFPVVTYGLMALTILVFVYQSWLPSAGFDRLTIDYGMIPIVVRDLYPQPLPWLPDWANLVTYAFLHADWLHLLANMLFLWIFGDNVEDAMGHFRFIVFYALCCVGGGLAHLLMNLDDNSPLIGASGAVAGVMGAYLMLYPRASVIVLVRLIVPIPVPIPALWMLGIWLLIQVFYAFVGSEEAVGWWAHVGGFATGALLVPLLKRRDVPLFGGRL